MTDDRKRKVENRRQKSPVKFAALVFFEALVKQKQKIG